MVDIAVYVESKLLPPVQDVLSALVQQFPQISDVELWAETTDRTLPVLVLGNMPPITPAFYVKTLSQKQILSTPSALTELEVALKNLLEPPTFPPMEYEVVEYLTPEQEAALGNVLVVDIETGGPFDIAIRPNEKYLLCVGINDGRHIYVFNRDGVNYATRGADQLLRILTKRDRKLIAHNMKFDFPVQSELLGLRARGREIYGHFDTMLMHHSINHGAKEHDLKNLAKKYLGADDWEKDKDKYLGKPKDFANVPPEILHEYNAYDVYWTWHLYKYFTKVAASEKERIGKVALHEFRMSNFFQDVEKSGVAVDVPYLAKLKEEYDAAEIPVLARLRELTRKEDFNPGSWQQVQKAFKAEGVTLKSTDEKHLLALNLSPESDPVLYEIREKLLEIRGIRKMRGTYVEGIQKRLRGNIVYPTFWVHGTATGRLSSRDPNIQNIPRDKKLRSIIVPRSPGRTMVQVDYSQAELRVMACLSEDDYLISLFQHGSPDFFDALMPTAFPGIDLKTIDPGVKKDKRAKLKATIYGLAYNRQAAAIAADLKMPVQEAQSIINNFFKNAPDFYEWRQTVEAIALDPTRSLVSPFGRQYQAEVVTGKGKQNIINSALAFLPQSTASDMCIVAAEKAHGRLQSGQYGDTMIVATIHDAILLDVPDEHIDSVSAMVEREMEASGQATFGDLVYFGAEAGHGPNWAACG
jgi:DNA polymerase-1